MPGRETLRRLLSAAAAAIVLCAGAAHADDKNVKIGVLTDMSSVYSDQTGPGSVIAAQMAVEDSDLNAKGWKIEVVSADHLNKPDVGAGIARKWFDEDKVDVIADAPNSGVALAVAAIAKDKNRVLLDSGAASTALTNEACTPNTVQWTYDTYMLAHGTATPVVKEGGDSWFFVTADYVFGKTLQAETSAVVTANGGKVVGSVKAPLDTADFSSFLLQAQASKAKVIGLANAGGDTINAIKQAHEFGLIEGGQKIAPLLFEIVDVPALGLETAQGLLFTVAFYWDMNEGARAFSRRFQERSPNHLMPTMIHAGVYAAVQHYLKVLESSGGNSHDGAAIVARMKATPTDDALFGKGVIREDGRKIHNAYLYEVKKPSESKYAWDDFKLVATIPAEEAFKPLSTSTCPLVKK
ncbi:MAG: ABC transporter substrate-binding protein [Roseiarcus sp.]